MNLVARKTSPSRHFRVRLLARSAVVALALGASVVAAPAAYAQSAQIDIKAQPLGDALVQLARQANVDISVRPDLTRGKQAPGVQGAMSVDAALDRVLEGSGLTARKIRDGSFVVEPSRGEGEAGSAAAETGDAVSADQMAPEIVVTGSHIRGSAPAGANLIVLSRRDLDDTGRGALAEAIQTTPQVHGGGANDATTRTGAGAAPNDFARSPGGGSSLNLRGLGVEETLTLVNGRRLAPAGQFGSFADISALPMAAVERVEILADGASATYGADAMAGVINIIMDRNFEGLEARVRTGMETRSGKPEFQLGQTIGWTFGRGHLLLATDYTRQDEITGEGRSYAATGDLRRLGGSDWRQDYCSPGNILLPDELAGAIPAGQDGRSLTPDQIRRGDANRNRCDLHGGRKYYLMPEHKKGSGYLYLTFDATEKLQLSADIIASKRNTDITIPHERALLVVPSSNAFRQMNGFGGSEVPSDQSIFILYQFSELPMRTSTADAWSVVGTIGADYRIKNDWALNIYGNYGRYENALRYTRLDQRSSSALQAALASSDPASAFNPFGDSLSNSPELVRSFLHRQDFVQESDYRAVSANLSGSMIELPGGAVKLAVGGEYRHETFANEFRNYYPDAAPGFAVSSPLKGSRKVQAVYAELYIPLFSKHNAATGANRLNLSLSGRYDRYSDFGGTFNPKAGLSWEPTSGLTLRGNYGTSFKAPLLTSIHSASTAYMVSFVPNSIAGAPDTNGNGSITTLVIGGGNPSLKPEKGKSWSFGVEVSPLAIPGLQLRGTYFNLRFKDRFADALDWPKVFADPDAYEGIAYFPRPSSSLIDSLLDSVDEVRAGIPPAGSVEAVLDTRTLNFASQLVDGVDVGADYEWRARGGKLTVSGEVSYLSRYKSRLGQSVAVTSYVGDVGLPPRWKARGGLGWTRGWISLNGWINHTAAYTNKRLEPDEPVSSYTTVDLSAHFRIGRWVRGADPDRVKISLYANNVFDEAPPFVDNFGFAFDGANADVVGRRIAAQLTARW